MNGYECGSCGQAPCVCEEVKRNQRIREGKVALESIWQAFAHLPHKRFGRLRMKLVKLLWPDIIKAAEDLKEYYWRN